MKKNYKLFLRIETEIAEKLKKESKELDISLSELCRQKLNHNIIPIKRIEEILLRIDRRMSKKCE